MIVSRRSKVLKMLAFMAWNGMENMYRFRITRKVYLKFHMAKRQRNFEDYLERCGSYFGKQKVRSVYENIGCSICESCNCDTCEFKYSTVCDAAWI